MRSILVYKFARSNERRQEVYESPGGNTPQSINYTATYPPSWKLSKLDEPDMQDTAGETGASS